MGRSGALCLTVLAAPVLLAQTVDFGARVTVAKPVMDVDGGGWLKGRGAAGFGLMVPFRLGQDQALVPRLDLLDLKTGPVNLLAHDNSVRLYTEQAKVQTRSLGLDYDYFFSSQEEGFYAGLGLAFSEASFSRQVPLSADAGPPVAVWAGDQTKKAVQYALQAGWKFNLVLGSEVRFTQADYKGVGTKGTLVKAPVFSWSLTAEF